MVAKIIDGHAVARQVRAQCRDICDTLKAGGVTPGLAVIIVGNDPASKVYVANKMKACSEVGLSSTVYAFEASVEGAVVEAEIERLNADPSVHGILVQLPLPKHFDVRRVLGAISIDKDVDGFHLYNVGGLVLGDTVFPPCTPFGVQKMLMQQDATVCICHAKTRDLAQFTILADILVVAAGRPNLITKEMVRTGAVVIDVGINRLPDGRLVGDVDFEGVRQKASYITPVPGGVGPMTVTMLVYNTVHAAKRQADKAPVPA
jgi:methylenetetrahydrofolate dehydrogenase (NADP+)/methenyltetrahydrofolate cyclohydrolase